MQVFNRDDGKRTVGFSGLDDYEKPRVRLLSSLDITRIETTHHHRSGNKAGGAAHREKPDCTKDKGQEAKDCHSHDSP